MSALIERFCDGHCERDPEGPLVTTVEGGWAYCAGHGESGHQWRAIDPRPRQQLEADIAAGLV
ncbi:MAG TPA: hypothetical protein VGR85_00260 [Candidatus Limnocylindria bacterium]|jgi:hypothetical protein|nr:hypothetical protein [Candidatus Limnocylindria bacterium]